jgi:hypothetical protein
MARPNGKLAWQLIFSVSQTSYRGHVLSPIFWKIKSNEKVSKLDYIRFILKKSKT